MRGFYTSDDETAKREPKPESGKGKAESVTSNNETAKREREQGRKKSNAKKITESVLCVLIAGLIVAIIPDGHTIAVSIIACLFSLGAIWR